MIAQNKAAWSAGFATLMAWQDGAWALRLVNVQAIGEVIPADGDGTQTHLIVYTRKVTVKHSLSEVLALLSGMASGDSASEASGDGPTPVERFGVDSEAARGACDCGEGTCATCYPYAAEVAKGTPPEIAREIAAKALGHAPEPRTLGIAMEEGNTIIARTVDSLTPVLFPWQKVDARLQAGLATLYRLAFVRGHDDAQARYDDGYRQGWIDATAVADAGAAP